VPCWHPIKIHGALVEVLSWRTAEILCKYIITPDFDEEVIAQILATEDELVAQGGIEPPTQGFSVLCSTD
jgi:hypothetical protein